MDYFKESVRLHKELQGKIEIRVKAPLETKDDLSLAYAPWVAEPCKEISEDVEKAYDYTMKWNTIAIISDGSAILGLGNIWAEAALPVMEWKAALHKKFSGINALPIVLDTQDTEKIIETIKHIAPGFGGIHLEDISAPRCFEIEERLNKELSIPVYHDDQHWSAMVVLAGIINSIKILGKKKEDVKVVINGIWAWGVAITNILLKFWIKDILLVDSVWTIYGWREKLNESKITLLNRINAVSPLNQSWESPIMWGLEMAIKWRDIFIWVSVSGALTESMVTSMAKDPIILALANPMPEIMPELAKKAWAAIIATGRSDYPNQVNNVLVFPWIFKGALKYRIEDITDEMKIKASESLANFVKNPTVDNIVPSPFEPGLVDIIAESVKI